VGTPVTTPHYPALLSAHIDDDALELHALGRDACACDAAAIEEHVHRCQRCRKRLEAEREYVYVVRAALRMTAAEPKQQGPHLKATAAR
jgi:hypothetical protein